MVVSPPAGPLSATADPLSTDMTALLASVAPAVSVPEAALRIWLDGATDMLLLRHLETAHRFSSSLRLSSVDVRAIMASTQPWCRTVRATMKRALAVEDTEKGRESAERLLEKANTRALAAWNAARREAAHHLTPAELVALWHRVGAAPLSPPSAVPTPVTYWDSEARSILLSALLSEILAGQTPVGALSPWLGQAPIPTPYALTITVRDLYEDIEAEKPPLGPVVQRWLVGGAMTPWPAAIRAGVLEALVDAAEERPWARALLPVLQPTLDRLPLTHGALRRTPWLASGELLPDGATLDAFIARCPTLTAEDLSHCPIDEIGETLPVAFLRDAHDAGIPWPRLRPIWDAHPTPIVRAAMAERLWGNERHGAPIFGLDAQTLTEMANAVSGISLKEERAWVAEHVEFLYAMAASCAGRIAPTSWCRLVAVLPLDEDRDEKALEAVVLRGMLWPDWPVAPSDLVPLLQHASARVRLAAQRWTASALAASDEPSLPPTAHRVARARVGIDHSRQ